MKKIYTSKYFSFIASVVNTTYKHSFVIISANFWKSLKQYLWDTQGPGDTDFWKKSEAKNLMLDSLWTKGSLKSDQRSLIFWATEKSTERPANWQKITEIHGLK